MTAVPRIASFRFARLTSSPAARIPSSPFARLRTAAALVASVLVLVGGGSRANAQISLTLTGADGSNYPDISVSFDARDKNGVHIGTFLPTDFTVMEDGIQRTVSTISCPPPRTPPLSITLAIDCSYSMSLESRMTNAKAAAVHLVRSLNFPPAQMGIIRFDDTTYIQQTYTTDTTTLISSINALKVNTNGNTYAYGAFMNAVTGAIAFTSAQVAPRYLIFVTDGETKMTLAQTNAIIAAARAANIQVYTVTVSQFTTNLDLRSIATQTGGKWFEDVNTEQEARDAFSQIVTYVYYYDPCVLTWTSNGCETNRTATITLRKGTSTATQTIAITVPPASITTLDASSTFVDFGTLTAGQTGTSSVVLTARNGAMTVQSITATPAAFTITSMGGTAPPFALAAGESRTITVQYRAADTVRVSGRLALSATASCVRDVTLAGGSINPEPLTVVAPNGGEVLYAQSTSSIRWRGVSPATPVTLDYSTDAGSGWISISSAAYALSTPWLVPNTPSTTCLMLAGTPEKRTASKDATWLPTQPADVLALAMAPSGGMLAAALADGRVKLYNPESGLLMRILSGHTGRVNGLSFSPDVRMLASAGDDGRVKIWTPSSGTFVRDLTGLSGQIHSVAFSADGAWLAAADQTAVILWRTSDWTQAWRVTGSTMADGAIAIDPRNRWVASANGNNVSILNLVTGTVLRQVTGHSGAVRSVSVSGDGQTLASGSDDRSIRVVNTFTWTLIRSLAGHTNGVQSVVLGQSGMSLLSASRDRSVRVWDVRAGAVRQTFTGHALDVTAAQCDWRTGVVASGSLDHSLRLWGYTMPLADRSDSLWSIITPNTTLAVENPDFAPVLCPGEYHDGTAHVRNRGNQPVTISNAWFIGADSAYFSLAPGFTIPPARTLQPGDSIDIPVRYFPPTAGAHTATLELHTDASTVPTLDIALNAVKDSAGAALDADTLDTGELYGCTLPAVLLLPMRNTGTVPVAIDSLTSDAPGLLTLAPQLPHMLDVGETDTLTVSVHPGIFGPFAANLVLRSTPCPAPLRVHVRGTHVSATPVATPNALAFPYTALGDTSTTDVWVHNPTAAQMTLDRAELGDAAFDLLAALPLTIAPHDSVRITVRFVPNREGSVSASLLFGVSSPCIDSVVVSLDGSSQRKPGIAWKGGVFPTLICPTDPASEMTVSLTNTGGEPLVVSSITIEGTHPGDFVPLSPVPPPIAPAGTADILLRFTPTSVGLRSAELVVKSNAATNPELRIQISAVKDSANLAISRTESDMGILYPCNLPATHRTVLRNTGTVPIVIERSDAGIPAGVSITLPPFPLTLQPGDSATVECLADTALTAAFDGTVTFSAAPCTVVRTWRIAGRPLSAHPLASRTALDFGAVGVGLSSDVSFDITNPTQDVMMVDSLALVPSSLPLTRLAPATLPAPIPAGGSITVTYRYEPAATEIMQGRLTAGIARPCRDSLVLALTGEGREGFARIELAELSAQIGNRVRIPITLLQSRNLAITRTKSFTADLAFDRSILWPIGLVNTTGTGSISTRANAGEAVVTVTVNQSQPPLDGVLTELECLVMLGVTDTTALRITRFAWNEGAAAVQTGNGRFTALGVCDADGRRFMSLPANLPAFTATPNPFNPATELIISLPHDARVDIDIMDILGRRVGSPVNAPLTAGTHRRAFDASALPSGVYIAVMKVDGLIASTLRLYCLK